MFAAVAAAMAMTQAAAVGAADTPDCLAPRGSPAIEIDVAKLKAQSKQTSELTRKMGQVMVAGLQRRFMPPGLPDNLYYAATGVRFTLLPIGRIGDCTIVRSSGIASIDAVGCAVLRRHLIARPKMVDSKPVASDVAMVVSWNLIPQGERQACQDDGGAIPITVPEIIPQNSFAGLSPINGTAVHFHLAVSETGAVGACTIIAATASKDVQQRVCSMAKAVLRYLPAVDEHGNFVPTVSSTVIRFRNF